MSFCNGYSVKKINLEVPEGLTKAQAREYINHKVCRMEGHTWMGGTYSINHIDNSFNR